MSETQTIIFKQSQFFLCSNDNNHSLPHKVHIASHVDTQVYGTSTWKKGVNYFRIDGSVNSKHRSQATQFFNKANNLK